jgi:hypothetical protein
VSESVKRSCATCRFCLRAAYGYSNWTVEGGKFWCLKQLNPALDDSEDEYGDPSPALAAALDVALACPEYREGDGPSLDVDYEDNMQHHKWGTPFTVENVTAYENDPEVAQLLVDWLNR